MSVCLFLSPSIPPSSLSLRCQDRLEGDSGDVKQRSLCLPTTPALVRTPSTLDCLLLRTSLKGSQGLQASASAPQPLLFPGRF